MAPATATGSKPSVGEHVTIVGGLGALGSLVGAWLLQAKSCRSVTLLGRTGHPSADIAALLLNEAQVRHLPHS